MWLIKLCHQWLWVISGSRYEEEETEKHGTLKPVTTSDWDYHLPPSWKYVSVVFHTWTVNSAKQKQFSKDQRWTINGFHSDAIKCFDLGINKVRLALICVLKERLL